MIVHQPRENVKSVFYYLQEFGRNLDTFLWLFKRTETLDKQVLRPKNLKISKRK